MYGSDPTSKLVWRSARNNLRAAIMQAKTLSNEEMTCSPDNACRYSASSHDSFIVIVLMKLDANEMRQ